jgi:glycosyltransferase involved in cell wall biosynthesis
MSRQQPLISIVIPTYSRPVALADCLHALADLRYPRDRFEVIVVDDESPESPAPIVDAHADRLAVTCIRQRHAGPAAARNKGASHARGEFIAFTDDDCRPSPIWLQALAARFAVAPDHAIGGRTINFHDGNRYSLTSTMIIDYLYQNHLNTDKPFFASNNFALPAAAFHNIGGFNTVFPVAAGEDREFCERWASQGRPMLFAPEALVYHAQSLNFLGFWRQQFNYGRAAWLFRRLTAKTGRGQFISEPLAFYVDLVRYPLKKGLNWQAIELAVLVCVSQLAVASGFFLERSHAARARVDPQ